MCATVCVASFLCGQLGCASEEAQRAKIAPIIVGQIVSRYSSMQPDWVETLVRTGDCDVNIPEFYQCMSMVGAWNNSKMNPGRFGAFRPNMPLLQNINVAPHGIDISGSEASAGATFTARCTHEDRRIPCSPGREVQKEFRVALHGTGFPTKSWTVTSVTEVSSNGPQSSSAPAPAPVPSPAISGTGGNTGCAFDTTPDRVTLNVHVDIPRTCPKGGASIVVSTPDGVWYKYHITRWNVSQYDPAGSVIQDIPADKAEFQKARGSDFNCTNADGNSQDCKFTGDIYLKTPYPGAKLDMTFQGKENK